MSGGNFHGAGPALWLDTLGITMAEVADISSVMKATSACGLGMAAPLVVESLIRYFPDAVARHVAAAAQANRPELAAAKTRAAIHHA